MNKKISDRNLLSKIKLLVSKEREIIKDLLEHLQEVQERRLYADLGYSSLFKYLVEELKYSDGATVRRIGALRLVEKVPEVKNLIAEGQISLSVATDTHRVCKSMKPIFIKKVVEEVKGKTKDEASKILLRVSPQRSKTEVRRRESPTETRVHVTLKGETLLKLEKLKSLKKLNTDEALDYLLNIGLSLYEDQLLTSRSSRGTKGRKIPARTRKAVFRRANSECEFPGCNEVRNLEVEHKAPYAKGGTHDLDNLLLYCRTHNQRAAIKEYGIEKMKSYLSGR